MEIPERTATDHYVLATGRRLNYTFDVDLGELVPGHHVVARGIGPAPTSAVPPGADLPPEVRRSIEESDRTPRDQVHFEHVPGLGPGHVTPDWSFTVSDDVGTLYSGVDEGAYDGSSGGAATHALRELGGKVPDSATRLTLHMVPGYEDRTGMRQWHPPEPWRRELVIDLRAGNAIP